MPADETATLSDAEVDLILSQGALELEGRLVAASNASFLGRVTLEGAALSCIYKPVQGERGLWDFPDGTLAGRERAARVVSEAGTWGVVPATVLRDGMFGIGMCQRWIDVEPDRALIDVVEPNTLEPGWISVLEAEDRAGDPVLLVHRDEARLRDMAVFDVVINNADRKGGHVLVDPSGTVWGCDHGVSFHEDNKLRTVLWGWAGEPLRQADLDRLATLDQAFGAGLDTELSTFLTDVELAALHDRVDALRAARRMPVPHGSWPAIPWPAF